MIAYQRTLLRLCLVPSAFSSSLLRSRNLAFLSVARGPSPPATSKWASAAHHDSETAIARTEQWEGVSNVLVCGDGDLSYSACVADQLAETGGSLTATVLEPQEVHNSGACQYTGTRFNIPRTSRRFQTTKFALVSTRHGCPRTLRMQPLTESFSIFLIGEERLIISEIELLKAFLASASEVLEPKSGLIQVALCEGQGGASASSEREWKQSWKAALYAAEHGLLLQRVEPFQHAYNLSSHRGVDRSFRIGSSPQLYTFSFPDGEPVEESIQLCCRHELHLEIPNDAQDGLFTRESLVNGNDILDFVRQIVPSEFRVEVPLRQVLSLSETGGGSEMIVFLIVYCGEKRELTRSVADSFRNQLETELSTHLQLRKNRMGRLVSRPFPYPLLQELVDKHTKD